MRTILVLTPSSCGLDVAFWIRRAVLAFEQAKVIKVQLHMGTRPVFLIAYATRAISLYRQPSPQAMDRTDMLQFVARGFGAILRTH